MAPKEAQCIQDVTQVAMAQTKGQANFPEEPGSSECLKEEIRLSQ